MPGFDLDKNCKIASMLSQKYGYHNIITEPERRIWRWGHGKGKRMSWLQIVSVQ
jgi:hypothetical protein